MIPGIGRFRRAVTLALVPAAFWAGIETQRLVAGDRCLDAGGHVGAGGLCRGLE